MKLWNRNRADEDNFSDPLAGIDPEIGKAPADEQTKSKGRFFRAGGKNKSGRLLRAEDAEKLIENWVTDERTALSLVTPKRGKEA